MNKTDWSLIWIFVLMFLLMSAAYVYVRADTPPLDRYGGAYSVTPDTTTGVHYKYWVEPDINAFEYRAMVDDINAIAVSTVAISECDKWRVINLLLQKRVDPYMTYPSGIFRDSTPFDERALVYFDTNSAVALNLISTNMVNYAVLYTTIPICTEGEKFPY